MHVTQAHEPAAGQPGAATHAAPPVQHRRGKGIFGDISITRWLARIPERMGIEICTAASERQLCSTAGQVVERSNRRCGLAANEAAQLPHRQLVQAFALPKYMHLELRVKPALLSPHRLRLSPCCWPSLALAPPSRIVDGDGLVSGRNNPNTIPRDISTTSIHHTPSTLVHFAPRLCRFGPGYARARLRVCLPLSLQCRRSIAAHSETPDRGVPCTSAASINPPPQPPPPCDESRHSRSSTGELRRALLHLRRPSTSRCRPSCRRPSPRQHTPPAQPISQPRRYQPARTAMALKPIHLLPGRVCAHPASTRRRR